MRYLFLLIPLLAFLALACDGDGDGQQAATPTRAEPGAGLPAVVDPQELFVVDADGGEPVLIHRTAGFIGSVAWSPDGNNVAFIADRNVYIADATGEAGEPAMELEGFTNTLLWSPEGDRVALSVASGDDGAPRLFLIDLELPSPVEAYSAPAEAMSLVAWLPGGQRLLALEFGLFEEEHRLVSIDVASRQADEIAQANQASLAPDGSQVAVLRGTATGELCSMALIIINLADRTEKNLMSNLCGGGVPAWSPDGGEIAYAHMQVGEEGGAYVLDLASGESRQLTAPVDEFDTGVEWLTDGSGLVIRRADCIQCDVDFWDMVLVPAEGGDEQLLATETSFAGFGGFSPESQRYLYTDDGVRVATLDGPAQALTDSDPTSGYRSLTWAPAGDRVAYVRVPGRAPRSYAVDITTGQVTQQPAPSDDFQLSPDRSLVAFTRRPNEVGQLWLSSPDGQDERLLVEEEGHFGVEQGHTGSLIWSPDQEQIAYSVSNASDTETGVKVVNVASGESRDVLELSGASEFSWSPDGVQLAGVMQGQGLVVVDLAAGSSSVLVQGSGISSPQWSPDGRTLLYLTQDEADTSRLEVVDLESGQSRRLGELAPVRFSATWSPDGGQIAFWQQLATDPDSQSVGGVYIVDVDTGEQQELAQFDISLFPPLAGLAWSPDGGRIAAHAPEGADAGVYILEADGSGMTFVIETRTTNDRQYRDIAWSPDGAQILFTSFFFSIL